MMKQLQFLALFLFLGFSQGYSQDLPDVWDFGATQLDASQYDNQLTVDIINSWYDASITPGSSGNVLPDFTAGDLSWTGGGNDRLRTTNTDLTRYDDNINDYADFKGRIYVNSRGATDRYLSLELKKYDEVTIWARGQDGAGNIHFEYAADPGVQDDTGATIGEPTELHFTANATGTYHIYDDVDKPSYYRIVRKSAVVSSVSGSVDVTAADGIPGDYTIVFTNENGDVVSTSVSGGTYSVDLLAGKYDVSLDGANGYSISSASTIEVTESTSTFDVIIKKDGVSAGDGLTDVWDFGAEQLDVSTYDNQLTVDIINSWYDASITPGSAGNNLPDFTAGDLSWTGGGSDRLRTSNTDLTRYDENVSADAFTGRVYVNSRGAEERHFSFNLNEDDVVTIWALGQDGAGNIHFMYAADPSLQNDTAATTGDPTEITFTAKFAGTYIIYDDVDKPSYYRIERKSATYATVTGNVDVTNAEGIPSNYSLVFTNEAGKTWSTSVSGGAYNVYLPEGQQFDVSLEGASGYSISSASSLSVTETTSTFDLIIKKDGASAGDGLTDVWDFGAEQLDASQFDNQLTVDIINSWYDASITPGSAGNTLPDFTAGDLSWTGGGSDRLRTSNTDLTRYDENVSADAFTGRVYVNSRGAEDRHFSFTLNEDDEVTMWALGQDGAGNIHFKYANDPSLQNDTAATTGDPTQITFTAKVAGTYIIYDDVDKPSYYRIERKSATYAAVTGDINLASAEGIPSDYSIVFTSDNGKTYTPSVSSGTYSLYLPTGHQYDISLVGAEGYSLVTSATLDVTESTSVNDIVIAKDGAFVEGLADVWDFGAEELDASQYNNRLTVNVINSWYDSSITPGSSGNVLPDFTAGDLSWTGGGNDRLRTTNTELTRYDDNVSSDTFTGRVYANSRGADDRYMSLELNEDDKVSLWVLGQDGNGELHFEYVADPELQIDVAKTGADVTEVNFVAKTSGTYHIYDGVDKPSYFRIIRKPATYVSLSGNVDLTEAADIPAGYSIVFSIPEGKTWSVQPADGKYQIDLPAGFDYSISVEGADGYVISNGASLSLTESTTTHDIAITKVEIYSVSGSITGLGDKIADLDLKFTASGSDALYVPKPVVDTDAATYTVKLEPNINYTISGGVDGYYIPENHLEITGETSHDIVFEPVPDGPFGDIDGDGVLNADDNCMYTPNPDQADSNNDGIGDVCEDNDGDGVINYDDNCPDTPEGTVVDVFGCEVFSLAANNYNITVHDVTCNGNGDGFITITAKDTNYTYNVAVSGAGSGSATLSSSNGFSASIENLPAGTYEICITVDGRDDYEQCFNVTVKGPTPLSAYSTVNYSNNTVTFALGGSDVYNIDYNGEIITTTQPQIVLDLQAGRNKFTIYTDSDCQGKVYKEVLMSENVVLFPNPTQGEVQVYISGDDPTINLSLVDLNGKEYMVKKMDVPSDRVINLDLTNYSNGIYLLLLKSESVSKSLKLIKS